jgi:hypothetical protein
MNRTWLVVWLLLSLPHMVYAGHGSISETSSQVIVVYEGDADEVLAAKIVKEKEQKALEQEVKATAQEVERLNNFTENSARRREERRAKNNEANEE